MQNSCNLISIADLANHVSFLQKKHVNMSNKKKFHFNRLKPAKHSSEGTLKYDKGFISPNQTAYSAGNLGANRIDFPVAMSSRKNKNQNQT